jgi:hypothetical protein
VLGIPLLAEELSASQEGLRSVECYSHWINSLCSARNILHRGYSCNSCRTETTGLGSILRSNGRNDSVRSSSHCFRLRRFDDRGISFYAARKIAREIQRWELAVRASRGQFTATLLVFNQHTSTGKTRKFPKPTQVYNFCRGTVIHLNLLAPEWFFFNFITPCI